MRGTPAFLQGRYSGQSENTSQRTWSAQTSACRWLFLSPILGRPGIDISAFSLPDILLHFDDSSLTYGLSSYYWKSLPSLGILSLRNANRCFYNQVLVFLPPNCLSYLALELCVILVTSYCQLNQTDSFLH